MKTLKFLLAITIAMITLLACESPMESSMLDDANYVLAPTLSREEAALILYDYLTVDGNIVNFDLSLSEALKLGITKDIYDEYVQCIQDINTFVDEKHKHHPEASVQLVDKTTMKPEFVYEPRYVSGVLPNNQSVPAGRIDCSGQEWQQSPVFFLPMQLNSFNCYCQARTALAAGFCVETNFLAPWMHTWVAPLLSYVNKVARTYGSNTYGYIKFQTTDSNGGFLGYSGARYEYDSPPTN